MSETRGVIMFNRGDKIVVRAIVALYTLRKYWNGPVTFYVEKPYPSEFDEVLKYFKCDIVHNEERQDYRTLVRKNSLFEIAPYDKNLWLDADVVVAGPIDDMFNYLDEHNVDFCIPHFCGWKSNGHAISRRIKRFNGIAEEKYMKKALEENPAINTGILSFKQSDKWKEFVRYWTDLAHKGSLKRIFIPDEVACQILYPSMGEWGLKYFIGPTDFNVSPLHDHGQSKNPKVYHFHGDKHILNVPNCEFWKKTFKEMCDGNIANINAFIKYADRRLVQYMRQKEGLESDVTIVTVCDANYVEILKYTFPNWRKHKNIDKYPVIVFVNGMDIKTDKRLDFLRLPNVKMIPWDESCMDKVDSHRELMLSAFVLGTAQCVQTDYWLKLDADSYATDDRPLIDEKMKQYAFFGHRWGYSRPDHIKKLDEWAKGHWKHKLRKAPPMLTEGKIEGNRFYHKTKRTISYIQLHKTRFTKFCVKLLKARKLPCPSQDTTMFFIANRFDPETVGIGNFKRHHGFTQGRGRLGADHIKQKVEEAELKMAKEKEAKKLVEISTPKPIDIIPPIPEETKEHPIVSPSNIEESERYIDEDSSEV